MVYFVDDAEGRAGQGLKRHEVENCGDGAFAAGLPVGVEGCQRFGFALDGGELLVFVG